MEGPDNPVKVGFDEPNRNVSYWIEYIGLGVSWLFNGGNTLRSYFFVSLLVKQRLVLKRGVQYTLLGHKSLYWKPCQDNINFLKGTLADGSKAANSSQQNGKRKPENAR